MEGENPERARALKCDGVDILEDWVQYNKTVILLQTEE